MSLFVNFKPHHQGLNSAKRKHDDTDTSRPASPSNERASQNSSTSNGDTFSAFKRSKSTDHIDLITKAIGEEGGDTHHRDLIAQLEELYNREDEQESPDAFSLTSKDMDEEGGFTSSIQNRAHLFSPAKPQSVNMDMDFMNDMLENKKAKSEPSSSTPKKQLNKKGTANHFSPFGGSTR